MRKIVNYIGSMGSIAVGKFCPICYPLVGGILTAMGLGFLVDAGVMKVVLAGFLVAGLLGLWRSKRVHGDIRPLIVAGISSVLLYVGKYVTGDDVIFDFGMAGLIVAIIIDLKATRAQGCKNCGKTITNEGGERSGQKKGGGLYRRMPSL